MGSESTLILSETFTLVVSSGSIFTAASSENTTTFHSFWVKFHSKKFWEYNLKYYLTARGIRKRLTIRELRHLKLKLTFFIRVLWGWHVILNFYSLRYNYSSLKRYNWWFSYEYSTAINKVSLKRSLNNSDCYHYWCSLLMQTVQITR